jgi:hypothetical protein
MELTEYKKGSKLNILKLLIKNNVNISVFRLLQPKAKLISKVHENEDHLKKIGRNATRQVLQGNEMLRGVFSHLNGHKY